MQYENDFMKSVEITRTTVLVLDACNTLSFAAAVDPMRAANRQAGRMLFDWRFATPDDRPVRLTSGLEVPAAPLNRVERCDLLLIVAGFDLDRQSTPALNASLRRLAGSRTTVAGIDGGPWVMARAGLLDGHGATTHWEDLDRFAQCFPQVDLVNARYHVSGDRITSGGAAPAIEMMLHLIGARHGAALAAKIAGSFIYDATAAATRPQTRRGAGPRHSPLTARAQAIMERALDDPKPIAAIARDLGQSPRALQLLFRARLGTTPQGHYLSLRLAEAQRLVTQTDRPLQEVALATGFASQSSFARAYRHAFGGSARQARRGQ
ncbi:GlxA family transcriptional regulator [Sulfitobacter sabulilitoris]|uniref:GlxA family transcriptional regulator n=2 Tax=Sulfitobacter sabulilitoris TaxID=2562655 RepID=A0A5S3PLK7_9RHOB|nr:GlxA family transcriptional regulator [Sulfitobacter sabulilitoris]